MGGWALGGSGTGAVVMALSKIQEETGLPKWKVALAVGGTLAAGYAMYYFVFRQPSKKQDKSKTIPKQPSEETVESLASPNAEDTANLVSTIVALRQHLYIKC